MTHYIVLKDMTSGQILYEGAGTVSAKDGEKTVVQFGNRDARYTYELYEDHCCILSEQEMIVRLKLDPCKDEEGTIETPFGMLDVTTSARLYDFHNNSAEVKYTLSLQGDEQIFHFKLDIAEKE
ncbi:hypothetical protein [uncultured Dubosiella sp.]|uniref:hypothetical protein n=1 Tax=uncultured Dubosiella sp. TaxID=1937011 RepID=UPI0020810D47|nr:hypothetical protein [uncultured Dubosiella sp.]GJM59376.1 hypothetical protein EROP_30690 [Erysipelotrichaceae bacterium OPF54]